MDEKMKIALLKVCERNTKVISPDVMQFLKELINTAVLTSDTKIDDLFLPVINPVLEIADEYLLTLADKIYEEETHEDSNGNI